MNYNEKLESLAKEFDATVNHAVEVMEEYVATAIEQEVMEEYIVTAIEKEVMDAIDKLSTNYRQTISRRKGNALGIRYA